MLRSRSWTVAIALGLAALAVVVPSASAVVPPKNCGEMKVEGTRYNIKADQIRCGKARNYARQFLAHHDRPRGYDCQNYGGGTRIEFRCQNGIKVFFAIRR